MDGIAEMRKHCSKCLAGDIKHEQLLGRQPKQFFLVFIVNLLWLKFCMFEYCRSILVLLEIIYHLLKYHFLNARMKKLQGYMKINFEASPTRLDYAEITTKGSLLVTLFL